MIDPASRANLIPAKRGEVRNAAGLNGYYRRKLAQVVLDEDDDDDPGIPRIRAVILAMVKDAKSHTSVAPAAGKTLLEYYAGQASKAVDALGLAEHFRKVARDKVDLALAILGPRILAMDPTKLADFFQRCAQDPAGFVATAEQFLKRADAGEAAPATLPPPQEPDGPR
jgi:hypothetical protein